MGLFHKKPKNPILEKAEQESRAYWDELRAKYKLIDCHFAYYNGGFPNISDMFKDREFTINIFDGGILFDIGPDLGTNYQYYKYFLPMKNLFNYSVKTVSEIKKDVTLPRVLVLGVLSLAAQKKTEAGTNYLIINFTDNGQECHTIFSGDLTHGMIRETAEAIGKAKEMYLNSPQAIKDAQETEAKQKEQPVAAETDSPDIPGQIEKLSDLFKKGILTQEEFTAKKAELLARI